MNEPAAQQTILIADHFIKNIEVLRSILAPHYRILTAADGQEVLRIAVSANPPDLILLGLLNSACNNHHTCGQLKQNPASRDIPVIFVTDPGAPGEEQAGLDLGAVDYITRPVSAPLVLARVRTHLAVYEHSRTLSQLVEQRTLELEKLRLVMIRRLGRAAEYKDIETGNHIIRMSHYSRLIAEAAGLDRHTVDILFNAAPAHDVGKIGIPDNIMLKSGKLAPEEWDIMTQHTTFGADIIGNHPDELMQAARTIALSHHERWDGSGYPQGLKGEQIPLMARIAAIADVFDALSSSRLHKHAWSVEESIRYIEQESGAHFDPGLLPAFRLAIPAMLDIKDAYSDEFAMMIDVDLT